MGFFDWIKKPRMEKRQTPGTIVVPFWKDALVAASQSTTFNACINMVSNTISDLPLSLYRRGPKGRERADRHPLAFLVRQAPNSADTPKFFMKLLVDDLYRRGNVFVYQYTQGDRIVALYRIDPTAVTVSRPNGGPKVYAVKKADGSVVEYSDRHILHIPSPWGYDGTVGKPISHYLTETLAAVAGIEAYTRNAFDNAIGGKTIINLQNAKEGTKAALSKEQVDLIEASFKAKYAGTENAGRPIVNDGRYHFEELKGTGVDNRAAQLLEIRQLEDQNISKVFGIPMAFLNGENRYNSIDTLYQVYLEQAIKPAATLIQQAFGKLLTLEERQEHYFEFDLNALEKMELAARTERQVKMLSNGLISANQLNQANNLPQIGPEGDVRFIPANLMPMRMDVIDAYMASAKLKQDQIANGADAPAVGSNQA